MSLRISSGISDATGLFAHGGATNTPEAKATVSQFSQSKPTVSLLVILPKSLFFGYAINLDSCIGFTGVSNKESSTLRHALITKVNNAIPISFFIININFKFYNFLFIQCIRSLLVAYQLTICYVSIFQYSEHSQELCPTIYCTVCLG